MNIIIDRFNSLEQTGIRGVNDQDIMMIADSDLDEVIRRLQHIREGLI